MIIVILALILSLEIAFFATQNGELVTLQFGTVTTPEMPIYLVVVGNLLLGLVLAWVFYLLHSLSSSMHLHKKDNEIKKANETIAEITKSLHQLEIENARLKEKSGEEKSDDKSI